MGLELFLYWANDEAIRPVMGLPITREAIAFVDSLRLTRIASAIQYSNRFVAGIRETSEGKRNVDAIVVDALGNGLPTSNCYGALNIGRCIFERTDLSRARGPSYFVATVCESRPAHSRALARRAAQVNLRRGR